MLSATTIGLFAFTSFLFAITPGPDILYIATRSLVQGRSAGVMSALGVQTGSLVHTIAAAIGLSALVVASAIAFNIVKYAGAAYLIYLGIRTLLSQADILEVRASEQKKLGAVFYEGLTTDILNPKVILFFLAFLPQFVDPTRGSVALQLLQLGLLLAMVSLPVNVGIGLAGGLVGAWLKQKEGVRQMGKWVSGSVFIALGIGAALTGTHK